MIQELVYTSLENGLLSGTRGFSTAAMTEGMSTQTRQLLESLSGYPHLYTGHDDSYAKNPLAWSHLISPKGESVLSRVAAHDFDYTGRTNMLAHHLLVSGEKILPVCGPAEVLRTPGVLLSDWPFGAKYLEKERINLSFFKDVQAPSPRAAVWGKTRVGEMGAAALAQFFKNSLKNKQTSALPAYVVFNPEEQFDLLSLVAEASALLTPAERWQATFCTYFTALPIGMRCDWRFCLKNDSTFMRQRARALWIDLSSGEFHNDSFDYKALAQVAVTGIRPYEVVTPKGGEGKPLAEVDISKSGGVVPRGSCTPRLTPRIPAPPAQKMQPVFDPYVRQDPLAHDKRVLIGAAIAVLLLVVVSAVVWCFKGGDKRQATEKKESKNVAEVAVGAETNTVKALATKPAPQQSTNHIAEESKIALKRPDPEPHDTSNHVAEVAAKETPQPSNTEKSQLPKDAQNNGMRTTPSDDKIPIMPRCFSYEFMEVFDPKKVPDKVDNMKAAVKIKYYGVIANLSSRSYICEEGEYTPGYPYPDLSKGIKREMFKVQDVEKERGCYALILFERARNRYLYIPRSARGNNLTMPLVKPIEITYPTIQIDLPEELKAFPAPFIEAFNKLRCVTVIIYLGNSDNRSRLETFSSLDISDNKITVDYIKAFRKNRNSYLLDQMVVSPEYVLYTKITNSITIDKAKEENIKLDFIRDLKSIPQNSTAFDPKNEEIKKSNSKIAQFDKTLSENVEKLTKLIPNIDDYLIQLKKENVPITVTISIETHSRQKEGGGIL